MSLLELTRYCDSLLRISEIDDWPNALNGLQIENSGRVKKIGAAVDVSTRTLAVAAERGINLLVVHHGLFWPGLQSITGDVYRQLKRAC
jgi:putative NIF3 family GTP cyclohydrolase 1 type 2